MKYLAVCISVVFLAVLSFSQGQPARSRQLNHSVATLYQSGKYDEAIPIAEEIVGLERKTGNTRNLVIALENLAQIKIARSKRLIAELNAGVVEPRAIKASVAILRSDPESAEANLREAIRTADAAAPELREQRIAMRNSLAWLLYYFQPADPEVVIAVDRTGRDKFEMRSRARFVKRVREGEGLFEEALKVSTEDGADINSGLITTYNFAEFALATGDLENALNLLEKCISDVERIHGTKSASLVQPLELYIKALATTGQDDLAFEMVSRLVRVTGKSAGIPKSLVDISLRADKVFAPVNSSGVELNAMANKERATLSGRARTVNGSLDSILAASTHGKLYYDATGPININKVPVKVLVDEAGRVVEAEAAVTDKDLKKDAEAAVREWKFKPFTSGGQPRKLKGYVVCTVFTDRLIKRP